MVFIVEGTGRIYAVALYGTSNSFWPRLAIPAM